VRKNIVAIIALAIIAVMALSGCGASGADKSWEKVKEKGEFVLGLDDSFPPMGFRDENQEIVGFDIDAAREVCNRLGINLKLQPIDWTAKEQELNTGNIDCIWNGFTINDERKKNVLFTEPYMDNRQVLVVMADSDYMTLDDLDGKKVALQAGSSAADALNSAQNFKDKLADVIELDDNMTALMDLEKGGVDAVIMDEVVARYNIQMQGKNFRVLDEALGTEQYGIGFRKNDKKLMEKVQETLREMAKDGTLAKISEKWMGKDVTVLGK